MEIKRLCVQWPRFGPYHLARLEAAHRLFVSEDVELIGLETASDDNLYGWAVERGPSAFRREQVFPGRVFDEIPPREMAAGVDAALDRLDPDAVGIHSYSLPDARACLAWCRRRRRVAVLMYDSNERDAPRVGWREAAKRVLVSQYDTALVAGHPHGRYAVRLGIAPDRVFYGYDVVDNAYFAAHAEAARRDPAAVRHLPGLGEDTPFFLASARFIERKDLPTLLRAYGAYRRRSPAPWRLVLLGDGALRPQLEALLRDDGIRGVALPGWRQLAELPAYYGLASAFVHPALVDQWGLVVNEAMASGLPVAVSTGAGCAEDLVREGENGFTFAPADVGGLADRLHAMAHEADLNALGRRSREVIASWPLERFGESLLAAARAGAATASMRRPDPRARALIALMRWTARSSRTFHSVES